MSYYCLGDPLPSFPDLSKIHLPTGINFPGLPTLPSPIFPSINAPSLETFIAGAELQMSQIILTVTNMVKPMLDLVGQSLAEWLPPMPAIPTFSITDILSGKIDKMVESIRNLVKQGFTFSLPLMPKLYPTMDISDISTIQTLQFIIHNYLVMIAMKIIDLINQVTSILQIGMPTFPTIPSESQIIAMMGTVIDSSIKSSTDFVNYVKKNGGDAIQFLSKLTFPGLPSMPKIPGLPGVPAIPAAPRIPSIPAVGVVIPEVTITAQISNFMTNLILGLLQTIMAFINSTLKSFMTFTFPTICI